MKRKILLLIFHCSLFIIILPFVIRVLSFYTDKLQNSDSDYYEAFLKNNKTFSVEIPNNITFAGEKVPVEIFDVHERLDRELQVNVYWQSNTLLMIKRANRFFPVIEPILKKNKIPDDFKYLALIESGFINKSSPAGAEGFWQFLKETGIKYGLEINNEVDERYNLEKATEAACKYLNEAYGKYNSWTLAAVSYNAGFTGIDKQIEKQKLNINSASGFQHSAFYDLLLNEESSRYIFRILTMKTILTSPVKYGYYLRKKDLYPVIPENIVKVDTAINNFADFAFKNKINYKIFKIFNPWLKDNHLTNKDRKEYTFKIPKQDFLDYDMLLKQIEDQNSIYKDTLNNSKF